MKLVAFALSLFCCFGTVIAKELDYKNAEAKYELELKNKRAEVRGFKSGEALFDYSSSILIKERPIPKRTLVELDTTIHVYEKYPDRSAIRFYFKVDECIDKKPKLAPTPVRLNDKVIEHTWRCVQYKQQQAMVLIPGEEAEGAFIKEQFKTKDSAYLESYFGLVKISTVGFEEAWAKYTGTKLP